MTAVPDRGTTGVALRAAADVLTASRVVVALALLTGRPGPRAAVALVAWSWASDAADGPAARRSGTPGRLGRHDHAVDAAVAASMVWYLGAVEAVPTVASRVVAVALLALWAATRVMAAQMLLQALAGAAFAWWAAELGTPTAWVLPVLAAGLLLLEWRRVVTELVPGFLRGWRDLLSRRAATRRTAGDAGPGRR